MTVVPAHRRSDRYEPVLIAMAMLLIMSGWNVCLLPSLLPAAYQRSLQEIRSDFLVRRPAALLLAQQHITAFPEDALGLAFAAEAAAMQSEHDLAISYYRRLPGDGGRWEFLSHYGQARRCVVLGRVTDAERHLRWALELAPHHIAANELLGHLLQVEGRSWESASHFFSQIRRGKCRGDELLAMATMERFHRSDDRLERAALSLDPPEVLMKMTLARRALFENRTAEAEVLLREIIASRPDLGEAQGRLGRVIVDRGDLAEFLEWRGSLPDEARNDPEVWFVQGLQARRLGQIEGAIRCFLEVLALSPNHLNANLQAAACLERTGKTDVAAMFAQRGKLLGELETTLNVLRASSDDTLMTKTANLLGNLGRFWEAAGWSFVRTRLEVPREGPRREMRRWLQLARIESGPVAASSLPSRWLNRRDFPTPRWPAPSASAQTEPFATSAGPTWSFVDDAERLGIGFEYFEGTTEETRLQHIFNVMGGGLGVIDYDLDAWPDLYLAQAHDWRNPLPQPEHFDRLFRNLQAEQFVDVTRLAGLGDVSFSHGVTVGDFDQDGFPDIYVGNKGPNRLYHNRGDGTFADVTAAAGVAGNEWTTSSVLADFNNDGLPDLYVLNYTLLEETARKECLQGNGQPTSCTPDVLTAEADRFYVNLGDGGFRDVSEAAGIRELKGKGLGVIAWDFAGDGRLGLFVANDTTPNFLLLNHGEDARGVPRFSEDGVVRGIAVNADGNVQASMGVAAGDANSDGRIDLFITTFFNDSNTLYSQDQEHFFDDLTRPFALRDPGFQMLGFGCQFADLDGDGWEDLIATNGHVSPPPSGGDSDRMSPQVFQNLRGRRFAEVPHTSLGPFFEQRYLGRGLAKLDWNRDGKIDVGISHLHAPFALLTNHTTPSSPLGQRLVIQLIGRNGCREPTGASVRMKTRHAETVRLQTAGDGFLVTNERRLDFVVPAGETSADFEVQWPTGTIQNWPGIPAGREIVLIEGRQAAATLRTFSNPE